MTHPVGSHQPSAGDRPRPDTAVLLRRKLNPSADLTRLSVFAEDRWVLSPGVFEAHTHALSLNFTTVPEPFREQVKHYFWQLINHPAPQALRRGSGQRRSLQSCYYSLRRLSTFVSWLHNRGATSFGEVTSVDLDRFLD